MKTWVVVLIVVLVVLAAVLVALYFLGNKMQKKQAEQEMCIRDSHRALQSLHSAA